MATIKTKYEIGDKVWILNNFYNIVECIIIEIKINATISCKLDISEQYLLKELNTGYCSYHHKNYIFDTKNDCKNNIII